SYAYVHQRLNADELEFLHNPLISLHMVWESYHVVWFALGVLLFLTALVFALRGKRDATTMKRDPLWQRIALALFLLACVYGKASHYPLRWSDAYVARDPFAPEPAPNPPPLPSDTTPEP